MYQPDFPPVPYRLGLYPVVDSVAWIARLLEAGVRTLQLRIRINAMRRWKPMWLPPLRWGVGIMPACLSMTTGGWPLSTGRTACIWVRRTRKQRI